VSERWWGGGSGEDGVREAGSTKGGVVVGVDGKRASGLGVCASVDV
jgi:hypothetical protein